MKVVPTSIPDVLVLEPTIFADARGFFLESFNQREFNRAVGANYSFVQDNFSHSARGVLRGLHYQVQQAQGKLLRVVRGRIFDVVVDIRPGSPTFGQWTSHELDEENHRQIWIPPGLAHGFLVVSEFADVLYKTTQYYAPEFERAIRWNDPDLKIAWPMDQHPLLSSKDASAPSLAQIQATR